jgi:anti-sigma B factor antagonist
MTIEQRSVGSAVIVGLKGRLVVGDGDGLLKEKVQSLIFQGHRQIVLNLAELSSIDSSGLGEMVASYVTAKKNSAEIRVINLTRRVSDLLVITRISTVLDLCESEEEAVRSFTPAGV